MGLGSNLVVCSPGPAADKGVRTMGHTVGLKFKAQMGLGTLCRTLAPLDSWPAPRDESRTLKDKLSGKSNVQILDG